MRVPAAEEEIVTLPFMSWQSWNAESASAWEVIVTLVPGAVSWVVCACGGYVQMGMTYRMRNRPL